MNPELINQLRDIRGLDSVPWWPPAAGWWLMAALSIGLAVGLVYLIRHLRRYPAGSWHRSAWNELRELKRRAPQLPANQLASDFSELMRRIAIARLGRPQAAALTGERWLAWLQDHDPAGFDWGHCGRPLLTLPYAPPGAYPDSRQQLLAMLDAAFAWTDKRTRFRHV